MKRFVLLLVFAVLVCSFFSFCQVASKPDAQDSYKSTLDHLQNLTQRTEADWRVHSDLPHPEDPAINDGGWEPLTVKNTSGPGGQHPGESH